MVMFYKYQSGREEILLGELNEIIANAIISKIPGIYLLKIKFKSWLN